METIVESKHNSSRQPLSIRLAESLYRHLYGEYLSPEEIQLLVSIKTSRSQEIPDSFGWNQVEEKLMRINDTPEVAWKKMEDFLRPLNERESLVVRVKLNLGLCGQPLSTDEIGQALGCSSSTVRRIQRSVLAKLNAS